MRRHAAAVAGWMAGVALAGCDDGVSSCTTPLTDTTSLRVTRENATTEYVTDVLWVRPGERVTFGPRRSLLMRAERGTLISPTPTAEAVYTPPADDRDDRIVLTSYATGSASSRGWLAVRVRPSAAPAAARCRPTDFGASTAPWFTDQRGTASEAGASSQCSTLVTTAVEFHQIRVGEAITFNGAGWASAGTEVVTPAATAVGLRLGGTTATITGLAVGWATVSLENDGAHCRHIAHVSVLPPAPDLDAGSPVDVPASDRPTDVAGADAMTDAPGSDQPVETPDAGRADAGSEAAVDAGTDAGSDAGSDASEAAVDAGAAPTSFELGDVLPIGLVAFDGGLYWYDNADHGLHRFDLTTLTDRVVLAETSVLMRDIVAADGRLFWTTGPSGPSQVVGWRPGDAAPSAPLLTATRAFDELTGDGTRLYAHEAAALRWSRFDGTGVGAATSSSGQRAFAAAGGRIYFGDLGVFGVPRGVFRVPTTPDPTTLLGSRETVLRADYVLDDTVLPSSLLVDGDVAYGLGLQRLLRVRADGVTAPSELARLPAAAAGTAWSRMCLARGRMYMVDQFQARLWSVPVDGSAAVSAVASPASTGVAYSLACTADSVWWWSGPRLNRYRLP